MTKKRVQIDVKEQPKLYFGVFWNHYKRHERFSSRKKLYGISAGIIFLLLILAIYMDFGSEILLKTNVAIMGFVDTVIIAYIFLTLSIRLDIGELYLHYWKLRKILYGYGTYIEEIKFSEEGIQIEGFEHGEKMTDFVKYSQVKKINFYRNGIVIEQSTDLTDIYISKNQFKNQGEMKTIKKWYGEYMRNGRD